MCKNVKGALSAFARSLKINFLSIKDTLNTNLKLVSVHNVVNIDATFLVPGDLVKLASGGAIPADCRVNEGTIDVDQAFIEINLLF
jgi:P-type E1-E2 ATPase